MDSRVRDSDHHFQWLNSDGCLIYPDREVWPPDDIPGVWDIGICCHS